MKPTWNIIRYKVAYTWIVPKRLSVTRVSVHPRFTTILNISSWGPFPTYTAIFFLLPPQFAQCKAQSWHWVEMRSAYRSGNFGVSAFDSAYSVRDSRPIRDREQLITFATTQCIQAAYRRIQTILLPINQMLLSPLCARNGKGHSGGLVA